MGKSQKEKEEKEKKDKKEKKEEKLLKKGSSDKLDKKASSDKLDKKEKLEKRASSDKLEKLEKKKSKHLDEEDLGGGEKSPAPAQSKKEETADMAVEEVIEAEDDPMEGEGELGAIVVPLVEGQADLFQEEEKWLRCIKQLLDADVEVCRVPSGLPGPEEDPTKTPEVLRVRSPNGQTECEGDYVVVGQKANDMPLWKHLHERRWIYNGTSNTWLIGGTKQQQKGFACRNGYLHLMSPHQGKWPHMAPGTWRRVNSLAWCEDEGIQIVRPLPMQPGVPVRVYKLRKRPQRRLNGSLGRLVAKGRDGAWRVALARGTEEEIPMRNLETRTLEHGEVWLRLRHWEGDTSQTTKKLQALLQLAKPDCEVGQVPEVLALSCAQVRVPEEARWSLKSKLADLENEFEVLCFWKSDREGEAEPELRSSQDKMDKAMAEQRRQWLSSASTLAVLGPPRQRYRACLRVLAASEACCKGLWTANLDLAVAEVGQGDSAAAGVEAQGGPWLQAAADAGRVSEQSVQRASNASNCCLELLMPVGVLIMGAPPDRARAVDYFRWLLNEGDADISFERSVRADVTEIVTTQQRSHWLERSQLRSIEKDTKTVVILEHAENDEKTDWEPSARAEVHVCGCDPILRARAVGQVEGLLQSLGPECEQVAADSSSDLRRTSATDALKLLQEERQRIQELEKKLKEAEQDRQRLQEQASAPSKPRETPQKTAKQAAPTGKPSDPAAEIQKLKAWPKDNQAWLKLQGTIWANHPKLAPNWIRVWSKSKSSEYYVRLTDGKTSKNFADAKAS